LLADKSGLKSKEGKNKTKVKKLALWMEKGEDEK